MSRLPSLKRLSVEQYPSEKKWIGRLFSSLNSFFTQVYLTLNGNIEFGSNIKAQIKEFTFDVDNTPYPVKFVSDIGKPQGLVVISVSEIAGNPSPVTSAVYIDWSYSSGFVYINNITGLSASKKYLVRVLVI